MGKLIDADKLLKTLDDISKRAKSIEMQELAKALATELINGTFDPDPPTINPGDEAKHPDLGQMRIMDDPVIHVLKGENTYEVYLSDLEQALSTTTKGDENE